MSKGKKKLLFTLTKDDFKWDYFRGTGAGGQHRNKTDSCVRCTHPPSGAVGQCCEHRSQHKNKPVAFERMAKTEEFKKWHKLECARRTGELDRIEREVERQMKLIKVEIKNEGKWEEVDKNATLDNGQQV